MFERLKRWALPLGLGLGGTALAAALWTSGNWVLDRSVQELVDRNAEIARDVYSARLRDYQSVLRGVGVGHRFSAQASLEQVVDQNGVFMHYPAILAVFEFDSAAAAASVPAPAHEPAHVRGVVRPGHTPIDWSALAKSPEWAQALEQRADPKIPFVVVDLPHGLGLGKDASAVMLDAVDGVGLIFDREQLAALVNALLPLAELSLVRGEPTSLATAGQHASRSFAVGRETWTLRAVATPDLLPRQHRHVVLLGALALLLAGWGVAAGTVAARARRARSARTMTSLEQRSGAVLRNIDQLVWAAQGVESLPEFLAGADAHADPSIAPLRSLTPDDMARLAGDVQASLAGIESSRRHELDFLTHDGRELQLLVTAKRAAPGSDFELVGTVSDIRERKRLEQSLESQASDLSALLAGIAGVVYRWHGTPERIKVNYVSEGVMGLLGVKPEVFLNDSDAFSRFIHPDDVQRVYDDRNKGIATSQFWDSTFRVQRADGQQRWVRWLGRAQRHGDRTLTVTGLGVDCTEREHARETESRSRMFAEATIDALGDQVAVIDTTGTLIAVNRSWREFAQANGSSADRVGVGANYLKACEAAAGDGAADRVARAIRLALQGEPQEDNEAIEYRCDAPDIERWFRCRVSGFTVGGQGYAVVTHENITALRAAQRSAEARERSLQDTFNQDSIGIVHVSLDGRFLRFNQALADLLGIDPDSLSANTGSSLTHPDDRLREQPLRDAFVAGSLPKYSIDKRVRCGEGGYRWFRVSRSMAHSDDGQPAYAVCFVHDIHLRKLTELAVSARDSALTGPDFLDHALVALLDLLGLEYGHVAELIDARTHTLVARCRRLDGAALPEATFALQHSPARDVLAGKTRVIGFGLSQLYPDSPNIQTLALQAWAGAALTSSGGQPLGVLTVGSRRAFDDPEAIALLLELLAPRIAAELEREREANKFKAVFDASRTALLLVGVDGRIKLCSRSTEALFDLAQPQLISRRLDELLPGWDRAAPPAGVVDEGLQRMEMRSPSGKLVPLEVIATPLTTVDGAMHVVQIDDLRERLQVQLILERSQSRLEARVAARTKQLEQARTEADAANRAKSAFLATMSHEIRTPMNGVIGLIDVLEQSKLSTMQRDLVQTARQSAHTLLAVVDDVLDFSKIEAGSVEIADQDMDVAGVIEDLCESLDAMARSKSVTLTLFVEPKADLVVRGDAARLRQVLFNLVGNAVKFSADAPGGGEVRVTVKRIDDADPAELWIKVKDNGIGMDGPLIERLFKPFTQAEGGTRRRFGGTGLGLSIAARLTQLMGGRIDARSQSGKGSTFALVLPLRPAAPAEPPVAADAPLAGLDCLALGPVQSLASDHHAYLEAAGARAQEARDLPAALAWLVERGQGRCVVALDGADDLQPWVEALSERAAAQPGCDLRLVVISRGQRRRPRSDHAGVVRVDANVLRREVFVDAIAMAAGIDRSVQAEVVSRRGAAGKVLVLGDGVNRPRILVAEDNDTNRLVLDHQLALLGLDVDTASTGAKALALWRKGQYAALITDLHMPDMDGIELTVAIRQEEDPAHRLPIIGLTANAVASDIRQCLTMGMDVCRVKPLPLIDLRETLATWLPQASAPADSGVPAPASYTGLPVDSSVLISLIGDDPAMLDEMFESFRASMLGVRAELAQASSAGDLAALADASHRLAGTAATVGAATVARLSGALERLTRGRPSSADLAAAESALDAELGRVDRFLGRL